MLRKDKARKVRQGMNVVAIFKGDRIPSFANANEFYFAPNKPLT
jgi:hypothetical protein